MEKQTIQSDGTHQRVLDDNDLVEIKLKVDQFLQENFLLKNIMRSYPTARRVINYIPEIISILASHERGLEILQESGLLDAIRQKK